MTATDYTTVANIKGLMPDQSWSTKYDVLLGRLITRGSRLVDGLLKREPGAFGVAVQTTRYFTPKRGQKTLLIGELAGVPSLVAVSESGVTDDANGTGGTYTTWAARDYMMWPDNRLQEGRPYLGLTVDQLNGSKYVWYEFPKAVKIRGYFGFAMSTNIPDEIIQAVEIQTVRWWKRGQQAFQDVGAIEELGQLRYVKKMDPDIEVTLTLEKFAWS